LRAELRVDARALATKIEAAYARRIAGLLSGGLRGGEVVFGTDAVTECCKDGRAKLVVLAADASSAAKRSEIARATAQGLTIVFGDKRSLAAALGRKDDPARDAVVAVTNAQLAEAMRVAWSCIAGARAFGGVVGEEKSDVEVSAAGSVASDPSAPAESAPAGSHDGAVSEDG
jgi:ribosomal protein L7Ae-like RNA K-turn-binding protein